MIDKIAQAIEARLKSIGVFKAVERTVNTKILQTPPAVAVFLARDMAEGEQPTVVRVLDWDLLLLIPALGIGRGQRSAGDIIDMVRGAFLGWLPFEDGGTMPAEVPEVRLEGVEQAILVYTVRLTIRAMPEHIT